MPGFLAAAALAALLLAAPGALRGQTAQERPALRLEQNFPNPFTPGVSPTIFTYHLDADSRVTLSVYNLIGQEVVRLVDELEERGTHRVAWDGSDANGNFVPAGFYFYKLDAGEVEALGRLRILPAPSSRGTRAPPTVVERAVEPARLARPSATAKSGNLV